MKPILATLLLLTTSPAWAADLAVSDAFSRATAGAAPGVVYLTLKGGDAADRLLSASSPSARSVSLHANIMQGNVMQMRELTAIDVPAGAVVAMQPGGSLHLMMEGLTAPLRPGTTLPLVLRFEHAGERRVDVPVMAMGATPPHAH